MLSLLLLVSLHAVKVESVRLTPPSSTATTKLTAGSSDLARCLDFAAITAAGTVRATWAWKRGEIGLELERPPPGGPFDASCVDAVVYPLLPSASTEVHLTVSATVSPAELEAGRAAPRLDAVALCSAVGARKKAAPKGAAPATVVEEAFADVLRSRKVEVPAQLPSEPDERSEFFARAITAPLALELRLAAFSTAHVSPALRASMLLATVVQLAPGASECATAAALFEGAGVTR